MCERRVFEKKKKSRVTLAIEEICLLLGIRGFAAGAVKGEEIECEVTSFERCAITAIRSVSRIDRERSQSIKSIPNIYNNRELIGIDLEIGLASV